MSAFESGQVRNPQSAIRNYNLDAYNYDLPEGLIARYPEERRDASRMMVLDKLTGKTEIKGFSSIIDYVKQGDCLVVNNTRVIKARLFGLKEGGGARIEAMLISPVDDSKKRWKCLIKPGKRVKEGTRVRLISDLHGHTCLHSMDGASPRQADGHGQTRTDTDYGPQTMDGESQTTDDRSLTIKPRTPNPESRAPGSKVWYTVLGKEDDGVFEVLFDSDNIMEIMEVFGNVPLPPYLKRDAELSDEERYQTVYSDVPGAVAAPTAGLHFTSEILEKIEKKGVKIARLTLHVGAGTFQPVTSDDIRKHNMHSEEFFLSEHATALINETKKSGNKVIAVGTTTTRVLETLAKDEGFVKSRYGWTDIFLYPPYKPKVVDMLLTNFHLPKSTLLMLVSTFAGRANILNAYKEAVEAQMRFYSYGDCMLLV